MKWNCSKTLAVLGMLFLSACKIPPTNNAEVKITNGVEIQETVFPQIIRVTIDQPAIGTTPATRGVCTGTFVSDRTVLTAAHCVKSVTTSPQFVTVTVNNLSHHPSQVVVHNLYNVGASDIVNAPVDLALLIFPNAISLAYMTIAIDKATVGVGIPVTIVGYGNNVENFDAGPAGSKGCGSGLKRQGTNVVAGQAAGMISIAGYSGGDCGSGPLTAPPAGNNSATGHGDSGGPLIVGPPNEAATPRTFFGVLSYGRFSPEGVNQSKETSNFVNLTSLQSQDFLQRQVNNGVPIAPFRVSATPPIGTPGGVIAGELEATVNVNSLDLSQPNRVTLLLSLPIRVANAGSPFVCREHLTASQCSTSPTRLTLREQQRNIERVFYTAQDQLDFSAATNVITIAAMSDGFLKSRHVEIRRF